jgi:preprotein translocase subunit SecG
MNMSTFPILAVSFIMNVVAVLFVICCVALILIILIQKGRGGGLSAAFGGGMAGGILGSKTGDFLTWVTIVLVGVFLTLAVVLAKFYKDVPTTEHDAGPPVQQEPLASSEQPLPPADVEDVTSDANSGADVNSPGG